VGGSSSPFLLLFLLLLFQGLGGGSTFVIWDVEVTNR